MKKTILLVFDGRLSYLPPFQAIIDCLKRSNEYKLVVITTEKDNGIDELYAGDNIQFIHYYERLANKNIFERVYRKIKREILIRKKLSEDILSIPHDILWVIHEKTALKISGVLKNLDYILSIYELRDDDERMRKQLRSIIQHAKVPIVCEYNRGEIMRTWFHLPKSPVVLPNKPYTHPREKDIPIEVELPKEKIILYQGVILPSRNLDILCEAVENIDGYRVVLMGGETEYLKQLKAKYPKVYHVGHIKSPHHLKVTSHAHIGLVTYDYYCLNTIYCAPNKIWEYSGFGIPMLANTIPGLKYTVESHNAGVCVDTNDKNQIEKAIREIDQSYDFYREKSLEFYESCNIEEIIESIINKYNA